MKQISRSVFLILTVLIIVVFIFSITGLRSIYGDRVTNIINGAHQVPRGFGLENNAIMYLQLDSESDVTVNFNTLKKVLEKRLEFSSVVEYEVYPDIQNNGFSIIIPFDTAVSGNLGVLGQVLVAEGRFELREGFETDVEGNPTGITENIVLTNDHIKYCRPMAASDNYQGNIYYLEIELNKEGRKILSERAQQMLDEADSNGEESVDQIYFSAWINGTLHDYYSATNLINAKVLTSFSETGTGYSMEDVTNLSISLTGGHLDVPLRMTDILVDHNSSYAGDNTQFLLIIAFVAALLAVGVVLVLRYKTIGLAGFISILGLFGIMFLFLTSFYGNVTNMQITTATFGSFLVVLFFSTFIVIKDGENLFNSISSGIVQNNALRAVYEKSLTPTIVAYAGMAVAGFLLSDIFRRTGGVTANVLQFVYPGFSVGRFAIFENLGKILLIGGIFGALLMILINRLLIRSLLSFKFFREINLPKKHLIKDFNIVGKRYIYIFIAVILIAVGSFLSLTAGFGSSMENKGAYILTARITRDFAFEDFSKEEVKNHILTYFEDGSVIREGEYSDYYYEMLSVYSPVPITLDVDEFWQSVNESYEGVLTPGYVEIVNLQKSFSFDDVNTFVIVFTVAIILAFVLIYITMGLKSALISILGITVDAMLLLSLIVFLRIPASSSIYSSIGTTVGIGLPLTIFCISTLNSTITNTKRSNRSSAVNDVYNTTVGASCIYSTILTAAIALFVILGAIFGANGTWYFFSILMFASLLLPQYFSTFILPGVYSSKESKQ